jgi:hypothetical protein
MFVYPQNCLCWISMDHFHLLLSSVSTSFYIYLILTTSICPAHAPTLQPITPITRLVYKVRAISFAATYIYTR